MPHSSVDPIRSENHGRQRLAEHAVAAVLVALLLLMAGLVAQATLAERSRRATGAEAMRQFAAIAAWRFVISSGEQLHDIAQEIAIPLSGYERRGTSALPTPDVLLPIAEYSSRDHVANGARFAFRVDLPEGRLLTTGATQGGGTMALLTERLPRAAQIGTPDTHRSLIDTADGRLWGVLYRIVRDADRQPMALFGWVVDGDALTRGFATTLRSTELLPVALAGPLPQGGVVAVRVESANGILLFEHREVGPSSFVATDTVVADQGGHVVTVALDGELGARMLLGPYVLPRWWTVALLAIGALLASLAMHQLRRARELARLREEFVANVSHELRTPLAQVSLFSETLMHARERSADERRYFAEVIHREAGRLTTLVDGILRFARGGGAVPPSLSPHDVSDQLREAVAHFEPIARASSVSVQLDAKPGCLAMIDPGSLRQIVLNLLDNAVKYGPRGQTIAITVHSVADMLRIEVADEGPGIARADRERAFEPFVRLTVSGRPAVAGTGIGLAVVRDLAVAMGGSATIVEPEGGAGTTVVVKLVACSAPSDSVHTRLPTAGAAL